MPPAQVSEFEFFYSRCAAATAFAMVSSAHLRRHVDDSQQVGFEAAVNRPDLQQRTYA